MNTREAQTSTRPVAIVTGGARGLGLAIARHLAVHGFDVAVTGRSPIDQFDQALSAEFAARGARLQYFQHDTCDLASHADFIGQVLQWRGRLDCLTNNVGLVSRQRIDVLEMEPQHLDAMYDVNVRGTFFLAQAFAKALLSQPMTEAYRCIINVTSIAADVANVGLAHYCMSKAALATATKLLALRLAAQQIMVHEVRPGFVWRDEAAQQADTPLNRWITAGGIPAKRAGSPDEVGMAIAALAAGKMPYMTGQPIWLAGGINIQTAF